MNKKLDTILFTDIFKQIHVILLYKINNEI
jgi:hypothetical protein